MTASTGTGWRRVIQASLTDAVRAPLIAQIVFHRHSTPVIPFRGACIHFVVFQDAHQPTACCALTRPESLIAHGSLSNGNHRNQILATLLEQPLRTPLTPPREPTAISANGCVSCPASHCPRAAVAYRCPRKGSVQRSFEAERVQRLQNAVRAFEPRCQQALTCAVFAALLLPQPLHQIRLQCNAANASLTMLLSIFGRGCL